jgi:hypothetical protein
MKGKCTSNVPENHLPQNLAAPEILDVPFSSSDRSLGKGCESILSQGKIHPAHGEHLNSSEQTCQTATQS